MRNSILAASTTNSKADKDRKWERAIAALIKYNRSSFPSFSDPIDFYYQLERMLEAGMKLQINVPLTLTGVQDNYLRTTFGAEDSEIGYLSYTHMLSKNKFEAYVEKETKQAIVQLKARGDISEQIFTQNEDSLHSKNHWLPFVVLKQKFGNGNSPEHETRIINSYEFKKLNTIDAHQIAQSYIFSKSHKISITRFFYYPDKSDSVAYNIDNDETPFSKKASKVLWKVKEHREFSCSFVKIMFKNKSFYTQTLNLLKAIEKFTHRKITKIVTDWVIDIATNRYYLVDLKEVKTTEQALKFRVRKSLTELLATVTCPMCQQTYHPSQISKSLTSKLIIDFYHHLRNRGVQLSFKINENWKKKSDVNQVCDLCYSLVVQEAELKDVARKMAIACNSRLESEDRRFSRTSSQRKIRGDVEQEQQISLGGNFAKDPLVVSSMHQWRIFFFLQDIWDFQNLFPHSEGSTGGDFYLNFKMNESVSSFCFKKSGHPLIRAIKIEFIFSHVAEISSFLEATEIYVQISTRPGWSKPIAEGCLRGVYEKGSQNQEFSPRKYKQILLFSESSAYCILGIYIGVYYDGLKLLPQSMRLRKIFDIYKPEGENIDTLGLPNEWMEIISPVDCDDRIRALKERETASVGKHKQIRPKQANILLGLKNPTRRLAL